MELGGVVGAELRVMAGILAGEANLLASYVITRPIRGSDVMAAL